MKRVLVYLQGMAWRNAPGSEDRSVLMSCRTPTLRALARKGRSGSFQLDDAEALRQTGLLPAALHGVPADTLREVGRGGLEAAGISALPEDRFWYRADFVAMDDETLRDPAVPGLTAPETRSLAAALEEVWRKHEIVALVMGPGHLLLGVPPGKAPLSVGCPSWCRMEEEPMPPLLGMAGGATLTALEEEIRDRLLDHEVNQVRVDLKESPANALCLWGGSRCPDPLPTQIPAGSSGAVWAPGAWGRGLAGWLGLTPVDGGSLAAAPGHAPVFPTARMVESLRENDALLIPVEAPELAGVGRGLAHIAAYLERCDRAVLAPLAELLEAHRPWRLLLLADAAPFATGESEALRTVLACMAGESIVPDAADAWNEETCMEGGLGSITTDSLRNTFWGV